MKEKDIIPNENLPENHKTCRRCGRKLKNPKYQEIGYGPNCYKKMLEERKTKPLFEVKRMRKIDADKLKEAIWNYFHDVPGFKMDTYKAQKDMIDIINHQPTVDCKCNNKEK